MLLFHHLVLQTIPNPKPTPSKPDPPPSSPSRPNGTWPSPNSQPSPKPPNRPNPATAPEPAPYYDDVSDYSLPSPSKPNPKPPSRPTGTWPSPIVSPAQSHLNQRHITMMCLIIACLLPANPTQSHLAGPPAPGLLPSVSQHEHNLLISKTGMNCLIMAMAVALEAAVEVGEVLGLRIEYNR